MKTTRPHTPSIGQTPTPAFVIGAYHQLWQSQQSFRMSSTDLKPRPTYHHLKDSIKAHLTIVFTSLAVARRLEHATGWNTKKSVTTLRRYHTIQIEAGERTITAKGTLPEEALNEIRDAHRRH